MRNRWISALLVVGTAMTVVAFSAISASAGGGCFHGTGPSDGTGSSVAIVDYCFSATVLHVDPGTKVQWVNQDAEAHQVIGVGGSWGTFDEIAPGEEVSYWFDGNGVYLYSCTLHPGMVGAVVVGNGSGDAGLSPPRAETLAVDSLDTGTKAGSSASNSGGNGTLLGLLGAAGLALAAGSTVVAVRRRRQRVGVPVR